MRIICPVCDERAVIRSSEKMSKKLRRAYCVCGNVKCGHTFAVDVQFSHTITPSAITPAATMPSALA